MKKTFKLLPIILACMMLVSCGNDAVTTSTNNTTTSSTKTPPSFEPPPDYITALTFENFDEAKKFVEKNDLSSYGDEDKINIGKMLNAFYADNYLISVKGKDSDQDRFLYLGPQYSEIEPHISYRIYMGDVSYMIIVFYADAEMLANAKAISANDFQMEYYRQKNMHLKNWEIIEYNNSNLGTTDKIYLNSSGDQVRFWLDDTHHVTVSAMKENREAIIEFISGMTFEKVPLNIAE